MDERLEQLIVNECVRQSVIYCAQSDIGAEELYKITARLQSEAIIKVLCCYERGELRMRVEFRWWTALIPFYRSVIIKRVRSAILKHLPPETRLRVWSVFRYRD